MEAQAGGKVGTVRTLDVPEFKFLRDDVLSVVELGR